MTEIHTTHPSGFVTAGVAKYWARFDRHAMHDVFIVVSEGVGGEHIARTVCAGSEEDARQAHQDNYDDETIVAVHQ